uniref:Uncharacterized protein n=1 Tax=Romanomermis culicivorax TaxID=13658 RepID=A0A915KGQ3_ROMCU
MNVRYFVRLTNLSKWRCSMRGVNNLLLSANRNLSLAAARNNNYRRVWNQKTIFTLQRKYVHKLPFTLKTVNDRIYLVLNLYDKIDNA